MKQMKQKRRAHAVMLPQPASRLGPTSRTAGEAETTKDRAMFTHIISSAAAPATAVRPRAIERMHAEARAPLLAHFLALSAADRRLRFGRPIAESVIASYVDGIDFTRDTVLGVRDDQSRLVGVAHLAFDGESAEVGLSVLPAYRKRGVASALFGSAVARARCYVRGVTMLFSAINVPILRIARRFGMAVRFRGGDAEAHLDVRSVPAAPLIDVSRAKEFA
jgi:GNAT superfamily N-acetyltransferase